jgi:hypothetical protein
MTTLQYRQGDVLLTRLADADALIALGRQIVAPSGARMARTVLALGEATGHSHAIEADDASILTATVGGRMLLHIASTGRLTHEDHGAPRDIVTGAPVTVPPGWYEVHRKREYVPPTRWRPARSRRVAD